MNRLSQKKLLHKYTNTQLMKPTSITNPVRQHGQEQGSVILLLSRLLVRGSAQTHKNFTSGTLLQHSVGCPQNNVFLPRPQPQHLLPSVFLQLDVGTSCQSDCSTNFQQSQVLFSCQLSICGPSQGSLHSDPTCIAMSVMVHFVQALFAMSY